MNIVYRLMTSAWVASWATWGSMKVGTPTEAGAMDWYGFLLLMFIVVWSLVLGYLSACEIAGEKT